MAHDRTLTRRDGTLAPRRWPVRPSGGSTLRWALVAALLTLALGLLYLRPPSSSCPDPTAASSGATPAATTSASSGPGGGSGRSGSPGGGSGTSGGPGTGPGASGIPPRTTAGPLPVPAGAVGVPIRLAEPAALTVARPGARVDLLAVPGDRTAGAPRPTVLAPRALVLDVLEAGPDEGAASAIYLALSPDQAHRAVGMPEPTRFAIIVRP